jgi:rhodanese-related sulfurtransferase
VAKTDPFAHHLESAFRLAENGPDVVGLAEAQRLIAAGVTLIDVRNGDEFAKERIEQSVLAPLPALSESDFSAVPNDRNTPLLTICARGKRSLYGLLLLKAHGYRDVKSVAGGMNAWIEAGLPTELGG